MSITLALQWRQISGIKSPDARSFVQQFVQAHTKEQRQSSALLGICEANPSVTGRLPTQRDSNAELKRDVVIMEAQQTRVSS